MDEETKIMGEALEALSAGFDAGNYANVYVSENLEVARLNQDGDLLREEYGEHIALYQAGFVIGFFSSYAVHEIPSGDVEEWREAMDKHCGALESMGIATSRGDETDDAMLDEPDDDD